MTRFRQIGPCGEVYGVIVYWCTIAGAVIVLLGSFLALALGWSVIPVDQQFTSLLEGGTLNLNMRVMSADGIILMGLTLAIVSLVPAILVSLPYLWRAGHRWVAVVGAVNALLIASATVLAFY